MEATSEAQRSGERTVLFLHLTYKKRRTKEKKRKERKKRKEGTSVEERESRCIWHKREGPWECWFIQTPLTMEKGWESLIPTWTHNISLLFFFLFFPFSLFPFLFSFPFLFLSLLSFLSFLFLSFSFFFSFLFLLCFLWKIFFYFQRVRGGLNSGCSEAACSSLTFAPEILEEWRNVWETKRPTTLEVTCTLSTLFTPHALHTLHSPPLSTSRYICCTLHTLHSHYKPNAVR